MCAPTTSKSRSVVPTPVAISPIMRTSKASTTKRRRKNVSFFPKVTVKYCRHFTDYTPQEHKDCWMTPNEIRRVRNSCHKIATEFSKPFAPKDGKSKNGIDCLRGLEGKTAQGLAKRKRVKAVARNAVFDEQNQQINLGYADAEAIADVYYQHTEYAQIDAHMRALRDQVEALVQTVPKKKSTTDTKTTAGRKPLLVSSGNSRRNLLTSTSSRRLLTDKFFQV